MQQAEHTQLFLEVNLIVHTDLQRHWSFAVPSLLWASSTSTGAQENRPMVGLSALSEAAVFYP